MDQFVGNQVFYGHGKLLLSSEYFVLDGALALALPTQYGQKLVVDYKKSFSPYLHWQGFDCNNNKWFDAKFEFWHFELKDTEPTKENLLLQKILRNVRKQNAHFLRDDDTIVSVNTFLEFPINWGLGSSSTLIYNIAQWAYISPFELQFNTLGGSGYDIACAQSEGPIVYERKSGVSPHWSPINFDPSFKENIYFIYTEKKQETSKAIEFYKKNSPDEKAELLTKLTSLTQEMINVKSLEEFEFLIAGHETLISQSLKMKKVKDKYFADYWGEVKSLGAWGGDFVLVTSLKNEDETKQYFKDRGFNTVLTYNEMIKSNDESQRASKFLH